MEGGCWEAASSGTGQPPCRQSSTAVPPELPLHGVTSAPAKRRGERRGSRRTDGGKASFPHRCIAAYFNRKTRRKTYQSSFAPPSARKERGRGRDFSSSLFRHIFHRKGERCVHHPSAQVLCILLDDTDLLLGTNWDKSFGPRLSHE